MADSKFSDLLTGEKKDAVVGDLAQFTEQIVDEQSGLSGKLVKGAYATAKKFDANIAVTGAKRGLPELVKTYEPLWQEYHSGGAEGDFKSFVEARREQVSSLLLESADRMVAKVNNSTAQKVYSPIRGKVAKIVEANVGEIGEILARHAG